MDSVTEDATVNEETGSIVPLLVWGAAIGASAVITHQAIKSAMKFVEKKIVARKRTELEIVQ